jgi:hypothetical protein
VGPRLDVRNAISTVLDRFTLADIVDITLRKYRRDKVTPPFFDLAQRTGAADSRQTQSEGIEAVSSVARNPVTQRPCERRAKLGESHADQKLFLLCGSVVVSLLLLAAIRPLAAEAPSDAERLQKLEQAVSQLQKQFRARTGGRRIKETHNVGARARTRWESQD